MNHNLFSVIQDGLVDADAPFLHLPAGGTFSYGEVQAASGRYANVLIALGVKPGDRVAVQVEKSAQALILYLASLRAGAVYLPLNTAYTGAELHYFLGDAEPALLVCDPSRKEEAERLAAETGDVRVETLGANGAGSLPDRVREADEAFPTVARAETDLAAMLYTSGTTGRPKGAMLTHGNLMSNAETLRREWQFTEADVLLHALPLFHTHGLFVATNVMLLSGASMILLPKFDLEEVLRLLPKATAMMGVPTFYSRLLSHPGFMRAAAAHMRVFISGSAPLSPEIHREFAERTGHAILERYGMTETNMNTSNPYDGERRPGTVGFPLPGVELRITDRETAAPVPQGEVGMIEVRGPNVFCGYWRMPDKTAEEFRTDGFFVTGDLGRIDERGYVHIVGRDKDLVISGGYNVYPAEVEAALDALPGVAESAVIGLPHPDFGEAVTAVLALKPNATLTERQAIAALAGDLAKYKIPKRVFFVDALPRNRMGKIEKKRLRDTYAKAFEGDWEKVR